MLAASLKVTPRKLELIEANRFDELPDTTFVRALALSMCRALKVDPATARAMDAIFIRNLRSRSNREVRSFVSPA